MTDGVLRSGGASPSDNPERFGSLSAPWGFVARYYPLDLVGYWMEILTLNSGRIGVLLGCCVVSTSNDRMRSDARARLLDTEDPVQSLTGFDGTTYSALCAVMDSDAISYSTLGHASGTIAAPGRTPTALNSAASRLVVAPLQPGATALLSTGPVPVATLPNDCAGMNPELLADRVIRGLYDAPRADAGSAVLLYRHPPAPLSISLPAEPGSLASSRGRLRDWLNRSGLDSETCADVLLAVGEATANATEHAVLEAPDPVSITVDARFEPAALRLAVSDNGRWKPASASSGHRGHGIHLMNALMNSVELATTPHGTTVTMAKELPR